MGGHSSADGRAGIAMFENVGRKLNLLVRWVIQVSAVT